jgi:alpha-galactosidase
VKTNRSRRSIKCWSTILSFGTIATLIFAPRQPAFGGRPTSGEAVVIARNINVSLEVDSKTRTRVIAKLADSKVILGPFSFSETVIVNGKSLQEFALKHYEERAISDVRGQGKRLRIVAIGDGIEKEETVDSFPNFPTMLFVNVTYTNRREETVTVNGSINQAHVIEARAIRNGVAFWSLQSGSYERRPDWAVPLKPGFHQDNYLGMNADDYGGGTPVIDVWTADVGLAVGHDELKPELVSEPVTMPSAGRASEAVEYRRKQILQPGENTSTLETFLAVHTGDYFRVLREYRRLMVTKGIRFENPGDAAYQPIWCAWGFGPKFQPRQVEAALPEAKKLGIGWVTMDYGWGDSLGDWDPDPKKFPHGDRSVRELVDKIHAQGLKAQLWWAPLAVSPSSNLAHRHPDWFLLDEKGAKRRISYWNVFYLCPADQDVVRYHEKLAERIFKVWGFDGLKIDGQFLNGVPPCTNPAHHHKLPTDSVQNLPFFFKAISDAAHAVKPGALIELCPCGTAYSFFTMPYYNMTVASDPESSWQVRSKGKALRALMGDQLPYFGDHVELSDGGADFASTIGVGGVIGTQYRWPPNDRNAPPGELATSKLILTSAKEQVWKKWIAIYQKNMLPRGEYLGDLYDIGFDTPETHCIRKGNVLYYAFYARQWNGPVTLRGLESKRYSVIDYVNNKELGSVVGPTAALPTVFEKFLLIVAKPID